MNSDQLKGKWKQMTGSLKERWGKLTDDDLDVINGQHEQLVGKIQERYGIAKEEAQKQVDEWMSSARHEVAPETASTGTRKAS
jgi:uncharacterized protein YjbJ (UPF0337 family)